MLDLVVAFYLTVPCHYVCNTDAPIWSTSNTIISTPCGIYYEYVTWPVGSDVTIGYQTQPLFVIGVPFK